MSRITISYRRDDSFDITGRIFDRLTAHFGHEAVFRDIDNIPLGVDFRKHIDAVLSESDIILAVIGPRWIGRRAGQSRLINPADPVRVEIEAALQKDKPLIPVLVSRASMPHAAQLPESIQDFAFRNAAQVDGGQNFDTDIGRLIRAMERILGWAAEREPPATTRSRDSILAAGYAQEMRPLQFVRTELVARVPFFHGIGAALIAEVARLLRPREFLTGAVIVRRGEIGDCMFFIDEGVVEIEMSPSPITLTAGDFFGEMALLTTVRRNASVVAREPCILLALEIVDFQELLARHPELARLIREETAKRVIPHSEPVPPPQPHSEMAAELARVTRDAKHRQTRRRPTRK